jgi:hypothetical protein
VSALIIALAALVLALAVAGALIVFTRRPQPRESGLDRLIGERVVLQTKDERSLQGVLTGDYTDCVAISHIQYLEEANPVDLPGEATVLHVNLSWIHKLGPGD